jgi:hypothetical protein
MIPSIAIFALAGLLLITMPALSQQPETGPKASQDGHQMRTPETGTRGPSGGSPDTGYHGPRDVTKDREPGQKQSPQEQRQTGQVPDGSRRTN